MAVPTRKMISFAAKILAGLGPSEALRASLYDTEGMTPGAVGGMAATLLKHPEIAQAIKQANEELLRGGLMAREDLVADLCNVINTNLADFIEFRTITVRDDDTGKTHRQAIWAFREQGDIDPRHLAAIVELREGKDGKFIIKLEPKAPARQQLAKLLGWDAPPKIPVGQDGKDAPPPVIQITREVVDPDADG